LYRKFQVTLIHVFDRAELQPEFLGDLKLVDAETGEVREITISPSLLRDYQRAVDTFCGNLQHFCRRYGVDYIRTTTDTPFKHLKDRVGVRVRVSDRSASRPVTSTPGPSSSPSRSSSAAAAPSAPRRSRRRRSSPASGERAARGCPPPHSPAASASDARCSGS